MEFRGARSYGQEMYASGAWHRVVAGTNATHLIGDLNALAPPGIAISVNQEGPFFVIHLVGFGRFSESEDISDVLSEIDLVALLN